MFGCETGASNDNAGSSTDSLFTGSGSTAANALKLDWSNSGLYNYGAATNTPIADQAKVKAAHSKLSMLGLFNDPSLVGVDAISGSDSLGSLVITSTSTSNTLFKDDVNFSSTRKETLSYATLGDEFSWRSLKVSFILCPKYYFIII